MSNSRTRIMRREHRLTTALAGVAFAAAVGVVSTPAQAQDADASGATTVDELLVTAQKREENLLTIPLSVTAITEETLERKGVRNVEELSRSVPGLVVQPAAENEPKFFSLRGVGPEFSTAATVAVYVDDTPITIGANSPDLRIFDFDRIEVLRGPQGTLFGSSAMGGAIRYITPRPAYGGFEGRGKAELSTTSHGGENYELQGAAGGPLGENVAFRASGFYQHDGGYIDIVSDATGQVRDADANSSDSWGGRLALSARFSDRVEATASVLYQDVKLDALPYIHTVRDFGGVITPLAPFQKTERVDTSNRDRFFLPNLLVNADLGFGQLTSSTSWQDERIDLVNDISYFIAGLFGLPPELDDQVQTPSARRRDFTAFVQEVRLASNPGRFEWLVGGYYRHSQLESHQVIGSNLGGIFGAPPELFLDDGAIETFDERSEVTELAAFGEASFKLTPALKLTAGLRYSSLTREVFQQEILAPLLTGGGPQPDPVQPPESDEHPLTPKFSASYTINEDAMVYATAAKGFREGGPNPPLFLSPACLQALADLGLTSPPSSFESDNLWSYELGAKGQTRDRKLRATAALYQIDWSNIQQAIQLGQQCGNSPVANLGAARIRGVELDALWRPVEGLSLEGSLNYYFQAELTEDRITGSVTDPVTGETVPVIGALAGTPLGSVPEFTMAFAAEYAWPLTDQWGAYVRAEYQYIGRANRFIATTGANPNLEAPSYDVVSARIGVTHGPWEINLFANNLFDADPIIAQGSGFAPGGNAGLAQTTIRPRTIGVSLGARF